MYSTNYHKPASVDAAAAALKGAEEGKVLAGGQTLLPTMKQHLAAPTDLVDIRGIDGMSGVKVEQRKRLGGLLSAKDGEIVTIGATTTHAEVATNAELMAVCPSLCCLAAGIGDPAVRHMGTIGGSIANNDPAADYPAAMLALNATIVTNNREIPAETYFQGMFTTALEDGEIILAVKFSAPKRGGYCKFPNPASRYAMAGVFVAETLDGIRVAVTGAGADGVFRQGEMEKALSGNFDSSALDGVSVSEEGLLSDLHGSAAYRANLVKVMAKRAVDAA